MNQRVNEVVSKLKEQRKVHSAADVARIIKIDRAELSRMMTGKRQVSQHVVESLLTNFPEINEEWLRTGAGEMLKKTASAENHAVALAADEIRENNITVNSNDTIAMLVAEVAAQRRLTEKVLEQNSELIAVIRGRKADDL